MMAQLNLDTRKCVTCEKNLSITNFAKRFRKQGPWYQSNCKPCSVDIKRKQRTDRKKRVLPASLFVGDKWCRGHKKDEPKTNFGQNKTNADFLDNYCKNWRKEEYRKKHPKKVEEEKVADVPVAEIVSESDSDIEIDVDNEIGVGDKFGSESEDF
jgi:hypothetical protein